MAHIQIIIGSTRPARSGAAIGDWLVKELNNNKHGLSFEKLDLAQINLPLLDEPLPASSGQYSHKHSKEWVAKISKADGYIWVTPEYNHGPSAALKNAIDYVYAEWIHKPVAFVGYGGMGGTRAIEQLVNIASQLNMAPLTARLHVMDPWVSVKDGVLDESYVKGNVDSFVNELAWWTDALAKARKS